MMRRPSTDTRSLVARVLLAKARRGSFEHPSIEPPMGLMMLGAVLRRAGHDVRIFDMLDGAAWARRCTGMLDTFRPQVVGLSAITFEGDALKELAALIHGRLPGVPLVVGGPHASAYPEACLAIPGVTHAVVGEGEETLPELVQALTTGATDPAGIPGVVSLDPQGQVVRAPEREPSIPLDDLPLPAWDLIDVEWFGRHKSMAPIGVRRYMPIVTSRGCPYGCIYCHRVHGRRYRARSVEGVLAEIRELHDRFGLTDFEILDDTFNLQRERTLAILEGIARLPWKSRLAFPNAVRSDLLDREQVRALKQAGTVYLCFAIESAVPRLQEVMRKRLDLDRARTAIDEAVRQRIFSMGYFMLGFPTETRAEAEATVRFAVESPLHAALFFTVTPYAGTELYERWRELITERGLPTGIEDHHYFRAAYSLSHMTPAELNAVQEAAWRRFYLNPRRLVRLALTHPDPIYVITSSSLLALYRMLPWH